MFTCEFILNYLSSKIGQMLTNFKGGVIVLNFREKRERPFSLKGRSLFGINELMDV